MEENLDKKFNRCEIEGDHGEEIDKYLRELILSGDNLELPRKWITSNAKLHAYTEHLFPDACQNQHIFDERSGERPKNIVTIRSIKGTQYEQMHDANNTAIYAGGPGSMVGAALDSVLTSQNQANSSNVLYITYSFEQSNARLSGYHFHLRQSHAINADSHSRAKGHRILWEFLRRQLYTRKRLLQESQKISYLPVDLSLSGIFSSPSHFAQTASVLHGGFWHGIKNSAIDKIYPASTDWVRNRSYSQYSVPVLRYLESMGAQLGVVSKDGNPTLLVGRTADQEGTDFPTCDGAIYAAFDEHSAKHIEKDNETIYRTNKFESRELSKAELLSVMGGKNEIYKGYVYPSDGMIPADMNIVLRKIVEKSGHSWKEGVMVKSVFVDENGVRGVELQNVTSQKVWYQPCSSVVLSLGYTAQYQTEYPHETSTFFHQMRTFVSGLKHKIGFKGLIPSMTVASGCSGYFLLRGKMPIVGAEILHWSEVAYSPEADITLGKFTGGGNIGSERIPATYPLKNFEHLKKLFGERLVGILCVDSCPRAINAQNDVHFYRLAPGLVVAAGLGGTGMTKCGANGALSYLLAHPHVAQSQLIPGAPQLFSSIQLKKFVSDYTPFTLRALGLRPDYSLFELASFASMFAGIYFLVKYLYFRSSSVFNYRKPVLPAHLAGSLQPKYRFFFQLKRRFVHTHVYPLQPLSLTDCSKFSLRLQLMSALKKFTHIRL